MVNGTGRLGVEAGLTVEQILAWADAYHAAYGRWPIASSGAVAEGSAETWGAIELTLRQEDRVVRGKTTLARLLGLYRGPLNRSDLPALTVEQILAWADAHHKATGRRPTQLSGPVTAASGEKWSGIQAALYHGLRGLPGGMTLSQLLDIHRPRRQRLLSLEQILAWADAHRAATGSWPTARSGRVVGVPGEVWDNIHRCLRCGHRGLPHGLSLANLLDQARHRSPGSERAGIRG